MVEQQIADDFLVFEAVSGSYAYGTCVPTSDVDFRGVFIAPPSYYIGLERVEQVERIGDGQDKLLFELHKFIKLAIQCSPIAVELLYTGTENVKAITESFSAIRGCRDLFLTKNVYKKFAGYSSNQIKKLEVALAFPDTDISMIGKHISHAIRVVRMGVEILSGKGVIIRRPDAQELLEYRNPSKPIDIKAVKEYFEHMQQEMKNALGRTRLPDCPDLKKISKLIQDVKLKYWRTKGLL